MPQFWKPHPTDDLSEQTRNILTSGWKTVEMYPFPVAFNVDTPQLNISEEYPYQATALHIPLKHFVHEALRRSRTTFSTLQYALCYMEAIAHILPDMAYEEAIFMKARQRRGGWHGKFILRVCGH